MKYKKNTVIVSNRSAKLSRQGKEKLQDTAYLRCILCLPFSRIGNTVLFRRLHRYHIGLGLFSSAVGKACHRKECFISQKLHVGKRLFASLPES